MTTFNTGAYPPGCTQRDVDEAQPGYWDEPEEECLHEDFDSDWEGRATCSACGHTWWRTATDVKRDEDHARDFDAYVRREMRRERIERWFGWMVFWRRWRKPTAINDEVPF